MTEVRVLTTGEAAKYCGVNFRTIIRWIERGRLKAYKLPGRGDHRIRAPDFVAFLQENDFPVPEEFAEQARSVLIIEDNAEMASAIARVLRREGYTIEIANNGFAAGTLLASFRPSIVTLDLKMPGLDGFGVLEHIRTREELKHLKVLVISAETDEGLARAREAGADQVMQKPFENDDLLRRIDELIGGF